MKGISALCSGSCVALDAHGRAHECIIVPVGIVVREVKIAVLEEAVGDEKIVGLISGR